MRREDVTAEGMDVPYVFMNMKIAGMDHWTLGLKLASFLHDYGKHLHVCISGFCDEDGHEMDPVALRFVTPEKRPSDPAYAEHEQIALQSAQDGIVLLENRNNTLPLPRGTTLNLFGEALFEFRLCAFGAGKITPRYAEGFLEAARKDPDYPLNEEVIAAQENGRGMAVDPEILLCARQKSDVAVAVIGRISGENADNCSDKGEFYLSSEENEMLRILRKHFGRLVVVLNVGFPVSTEFIREYEVDAVLYSGFGGMFAGRALMDVLTGRVNPSGRLPDTWAERYESIPSSGNFYDCANGKPRITAEDDIWLNTVYEEDLYVGYRYFETFSSADRRGYPFGYGLSYTKFEMTSEDFCYEDGVWKISIRVKNTGIRSGREVVQLYVSKPCGVLSHPERELVGFEKTRLLASGEEEMICLHIPEEHLVSYDEGTASYILDIGRYRFWLGRNAREVSECGSYDQKEVRLIRKVKNRLQPPVPIRKMDRSSRGLPEGASGVISGDNRNWTARKNVESFSHPELPGSTRTGSSVDIGKEKGRIITFAAVRENPELLGEFVGNMDIPTLARIVICKNHGWGMEGRGEAGRLYQVEGLELPEFVVADGNSGVNLHDGNIGFPSGVTMCASFDKGLMENVGRVVGEEAKELRIHLILGPGMNLHRNPLNGRQPEYFSEDPYLAGVMAGYYSKGMESAGTGACLKHLIANNSESGRKRNQSIISERAIRELYLRAFQYALEVYEPVSVMTAYNAVNGLFTSCDPELIQGMLFEECGFKGFVMTDWASYDTADVAEMAAAGNTWITPGSEDDYYTGRIEKAVADGRLSFGQLQENVLRIIRALVKLRL